MAQTEAEQDEASGKQRRPPGLGDAPGSGRVALDFVKTVSHVFGLDQDAQKEVSDKSAPGSHVRCPFCSGPILCIYCVRDL